MNEKEKENNYNINKGSLFFSVHRKITRVSNPQPEDDRNK
jgi:hypothetical protein